MSDIRRRIEKLESHGAGEPEKEPVLFIHMLNDYTCGLEAQGIECPHVKKVREKMEVVEKALKERGEYIVFAQSVAPPCDTCKDAVKVERDARGYRLDRPKE